MKKLISIITIFVLVLVVDSVNINAAQNVEDIIIYETEPKIITISSTNPVVSKNNDINEVDILNDRFNNRLRMRDKCCNRRNNYNFY